jgi:hypothetical protein
MNRHDQQGIVPQSRATAPALLRALLLLAA